jgi:flagellar basal-body rod protein FlgC
MSFDSFDISASGLYAQRLRMDTISSNIANVNTTRNSAGEIEPYVRKKVVFSAAYDKAINSQEDSTVNTAGTAKGSAGNVYLKGSIDNSVQVSSGVTVQSIEEDKNPYKTIHDPSHPDADKDGFVKLPNINAVTEMVDMISASRAYEANVTAIETAKSMMSSAIKIGM